MGLFYCNHVTDELGDAGLVTDVGVLTIDLGRSLASSRQHESPR